MARKSADDFAVFVARDASDSVWLAGSGLAWALPAGAAWPVGVDLRQSLRQPWLDLIARMIYSEAMSMTHLTAQQLHRAAEIREKIENLEKDFAALLAVPGDAPVTVRRRGRPAKSVVAPAPPTPKPKRKISKAGRARLSASAKARWAKVRAAGKTRL